jgi:hypothetical protein
VERGAESWVVGFRSPAMQRLALTLILAVLVGSPAGCRRRQASGPSATAAGPAVPPDLRAPPDAVKGYCVTPCRSDADCGEGSGAQAGAWRPTSPWTRTYTPARRRGSGGIPKPHRGLPAQAHLPTARRTRVCQADGECNADEQCRPIRRRPAFGRPARRSTSLCSPRPPRSRRAAWTRRPSAGAGSPAWADLRDPAASPDCRPGRLCDSAAGPGEARVGTPGSAARPRSWAVPPAGRRAVAAKERPAAPGRCRQVCTADEDCGPLDGLPTRCKARKTAGQKVRVCLPAPGRRPR